MAPLSERVAWLAGTLALYVVGYNAIGALNRTRALDFDVSLPGELQIPFVAAGVVPYSFLYLTIPATYLVLTDFDARTFRRAFTVIVGNLAICLALFLLVPVHALHRAPIGEGRGLFEQWLAVYYQFDPPANLFPSLHADMAVLSVLVGFRRSRGCGVVMSVMAAGIAVGAIVVKQHYIADLVAGGMLALVTWSAAFRRADVSGDGGLPGGARDAVDANRARL